MSARVKAMPASDGAAALRKAFRMNALAFLIAPVPLIILSPGTWWAKSLLPALILVCVEGLLFYTLSPIKTEKVVTVDTKSTKFRAQVLIQGLLGVISIPLALFVSSWFALGAIFAAIHIVELHVFGRKFSATDANPAED